MRKNPLDKLIIAVDALWDAYLAYGPLDDGRPEGKAIEEAIDALMSARHEANYSRKNPIVRKEKQ